MRPTSEDISRIVAGVIQLLGDDKDRPTVAGTAEIAVDLAAKVDHDALAEKIAAKLNNDVLCDKLAKLIGTETSCKMGFSTDEADGMKSLCRFVKRMEKLGSLGVTIAFSAVVLGLVGFLGWALWHGFVSKVTNTP